jgi:hypothetical protein
MQSVFPIDNRKLRDFWKISPNKNIRENGSLNMTDSKTPGYILKFRCFNCGSPNAGRSN